MKTQDLSDNDLDSIWTPGAFWTPLGLHAPPRVHSPYPAPNLLLRARSTGPCEVVSRNRRQHLFLYKERYHAPWNSKTTSKFLYMVTTPAVRSPVNGAVRPGGTDLASTLLSTRGRMPPLEFVHEFGDNTTVSINDHADHAPPVSAIPHLQLARSVVPSGIDSQ
jgi:hypothetical protein